MIYIDGRTPAADLWESAEPYFKEFQHPFYQTRAINHTARNDLLKLDA
jgi:hypothetical protein